MSITFGKESYGAGLYSFQETEASTRISSWSFTIDGHQMVFLSLGIRGTFVFDVSTGSWFEWNREGSTGLSFRCGQPYGEFYLMGGEGSGDIYSFDLDAVDDADGPFSTVVTGGIGADGRTVIPCYSIYLSGNTSAQTGRVVRLSFTDDSGNTWASAGSVEPDVATDRLVWRSLGTIRYPGRVFEFSDNGALLSFDGASTGDA